MSVTTWIRLRAQQLETQRRDSASKRGYDRAWQKTRLRVLAARPLCEDCAEQDLVTPATEVHHLTKIRVAPERKHDTKNLRALCAECHARRTAAGE